MGKHVRVTPATGYVWKQLRRPLGSSSTHRTPRRSLFGTRKHCRGMLASLCGAVLASVGGTNGRRGSGTKFEVCVREMAGLVAITQVGSGIPHVVTPEQTTFVL